MTTLLYILLGIVVPLGGIGAFLAFQRKRSPSDTSDDSSDDKKSSHSSSANADKKRDGHGSVGVHGGWGKFFTTAFKYTVMTVIAIALLWVVFTGRVGVILVYIGTVIEHIVFDPSERPKQSAVLPGTSAAFPVKPAVPLTTSGCEPFTKNVVHTCTISEATFIMQGPNTPPGLTFCWGPAYEPNNTSDPAYKKIQRVLDSGVMMDFDPTHLIDIPVAGYKFTPAHEITMWYWMTDTTCEAPVT